MLYCDNCVRCELLANNLRMLRFKLKNFLFFFNSPVVKLRGTPVYLVG